MKYATVTQQGRFLIVTDSNGVNISSEVDRNLRRQAIADNKQLVFNETSNAWEIEGTDGSATMYNRVSSSAQTVKTVHSNEHQHIMSFIHKEAVDLKPKKLLMEDLKWKYLVRSALRGKNIMMTGAAGTGKTMAAKHLVNALNRPDFYFNLGATQDPRSTLIGNTHFSKEDGTYFSESLFVKAIQTENAVILLDELSRAHPDAWNILMTVLDVNQRYLRLDEKDGAPTIKVAPGVSFIATANVGNEYTSTRVLDRALMDRFITIEMEALTVDSEYTVLTMEYPGADKTALKSIAEIAGMTRDDLKSAAPKLSSSISTRLTIEMASLIYDGFTLEEAATVAIYPFFSDDGGVDSERTYIKQIVQKYCGRESSQPLFNTADAA
jgi:nitric oxide reductase NorQ protein